MYISACIRNRSCTQGYAYTSHVYISHNILEGPITPGRMDRFRSTIAAMIALTHADILHLFSGAPEVCAANERRCCLQALVYTTGGFYNDMWQHKSPVCISPKISEGATTLGRLERFGSTTASMIALAHADILQMFSRPPEACAANGRRCWI